jgi:hypothetical protein
MPTLKGIKAILKALEKSVKGRYEEYPHAPAVNWVDVTIDLETNIAFMGLSGMSEMTFDQKYLIENGAALAIEKASDLILADLPAGGFPFSIIFRPQIFGGNTGVKVVASDVVLKPHGNSYGYSSDMNRSLLHIKDCLDVLDRNSPETMEKNAYFVTQKSRSDFPDYTSKVIYASNQRAAENKAMIMHIPHSALDIIDERPGHISEHDIVSLDHLTVSLAPQTLRYRTSEPSPEEGLEV